MKTQLSKLNQINCEQVAPAWNRLRIWQAFRRMVAFELCVIDCKQRSDSRRETACTASLSAMPICSTSVINLFIYLSIKWSIHQSFHQSINQSSNQSIHQSINGKTSSQMIAFASLSRLPCLLCFEILHEVVSSSGTSVGIPESGWDLCKRSTECWVSSSAVHHLLCRDSTACCDDDVVFAVHALFDEAVQQETLAWQSSWIATLFTTVSAWTVYEIHATSVALDGTGEQVEVALLLVGEHANFQVELIDVDLIIDWTAKFFKDEIDANLLSSSSGAQSSGGISMS